MIWVKFLIAISRVIWLGRSWELRTWSLRLNCVDINFSWILLTTSVRNVWRWKRRICILILRLKGLTVVSMGIDLHLFIVDVYRFNNWYTGGWRCIWSSHNNEVPVHEIVAERDSRCWLNETGCCPQDAQESAFQCKDELSQRSGYLVHFVS